MVKVGTIILAVGSIIASIIGSLTVVEYRLLRERRIEERRELIDWYRDAEILADQIHRECVDLKGKIPPDSTYQELLYRGTLDSLKERIQELKDHQAKMPSDADSNTAYFVTDVWTKYAMMQIGKISEQDIEDYPQAAAKRARGHLESERKELEDFTRHPLSVSRAGAWLKSKLGNSVATLVFAAILVVLFYIANQIALQAGYSTPNEYVLGLEGLVQSVVLLFIPLLHSTWSHLGENLIILLAFGPLVEHRENQMMYVLFLLIVMAFANLLIPRVLQLLSLGLPIGPGLGASGVTYALTGRELAFRTRQLSRNPRFGLDFLIWSISVLVTVFGVASILAFEAAWFSHLLGLFFGVVVGASEVENWWSPKLLA